MGQRQRAAQQERLQAEKRRRYIRRGAVGGALVAAGVAAALLLPGEEEGEKMPNDTIALVQDVADYTSNPRLLNLIKAKYEPVLNMEVGGSKIQIIEVGDPEPLDYEVIKQAFRDVAEYVHADPKGGKHPITAYDSQDVIVAELKLESRIQPAGKDITMFVTPVGFDAGEAGGFDVWSHGETGRVLSLVRSGGPEDYEAAVTEVCQGLVNVSLTDEALMQIQADKRDRVEMIAQEQICNGLSKAISARFYGAPFEMYVSRQSSASRHMATDPYPAPGTLGYVSRIPHLNDAQAYNSIHEVIPANFAELLAYPPVDFTVR